MKIVAKAAMDRVFLVQVRGPRPTWFALHDTAPVSRTSHTMLVAFAEEKHARQWACSLEKYADEHGGTYPPREFARQTKRLAWVRDAVDAAPDRLAVVEMPVAEVMALVKGTGMSYRLFQDPHNLGRRVDVVQAFDKAAVCNRLEHQLSLACPEGGDVV